MVTLQFFFDLIVVFSVIMRPIMRNSKLNFSSNQLVKSSAFALLVSASLLPGLQGYYVNAEESARQQPVSTTTIEGCVLNSTIITFGEKYNIGCDQTCHCLQTGKIECKDRCKFKIGSAKNNSCTEITDENDPECCVMITCKNDSNPENSPKVLVTQRSPTSISIAFDDFKSPNYEAGYVIKYKSLANVTLNSTESEWIQMQTNNTPFVTLRDLHPHSAYQIQVFVWEDSYTKKLGLGSELITAFTEDGCFRNNITYTIGEEFFEGCDLRCICRGSDEGECSDRCNQPYVRSGTMNKNADCEETPSADDACCVSVRCSGHHHKPQEARAREGFSDKPGLCPKFIEPETGVKCKEECVHDYHCTGLKKCCKTSCGGTVCANLVSKKADDCESITCGPNSVCEIQESTPSCKCEQGFTGDPNDVNKGCIKNLKPSFMCSYMDKKYSRGQSFNNSCETCICSEALEVECKTKCNKATNLTINDSPNCHLIKDPNDECCEVLFCDTTKNETSIESSKPVLNVTFNDSSDTVSENITLTSETNPLQNMSNNNSNNSNTNLETLHIPKPIDGCAHHNQTYSDGEVFFIECQLRCLCQSHGRLQCFPRCALDPGYDEAYCRLVTDPDDPECCKIAVCDNKDVISDKPELIADSAEAYNSTSVKLRVMVPSLKNSLIGTDLKLLFSIISDNETENERDSDSREWNTIDVDEDAIRLIASDIFEIDIGGLIPQTEYFMKVRLHNSSSNTVFVRTYPHGIDITFNGCFHGNKTIEVGQVFYEGDCEYKCVCREGGLRECEERCPIYIDTVGYENCDWLPAPDDPCCTVPVCDKHSKKNIPNDPDAEPFCISEAAKIYKIGQSWETGTNCLKKVCQCSLLTNGTIAIQCKGGCATLPINARTPSPQCPSPQIIQPDDPCICPYVVCHNNLNPLDLPEKPHSSGDKQFCEFKGRKIPIGEEIYDNCRAVCHCGDDARLNCAAIECPHNFAPHITDCFEWDIDPNFVATPPVCCPQPRCKNDGSCSFAGIRFPNFKHIPQELLPCGTRCTCNKGKIDCENRCPTITDIPPPHLPCPPAMAYRGHLPGDNCCLHWICREQEKSTSDCAHSGKRYKVGEQWDDKGVGYKRRCQCKLSSGIPHVQCHPGGCQPITERFLQPTIDCPNPSIIVPDEPVMCPYVICNDSKETGRDLDHVNIIALNSTSARIRFTLPSLLVGLIGHAELHYTTDLNIQRSQWNIQKFARPKRLFDTANIEYHLGGLTPDTTYFFQIQVVIEALQSGPESKIYKLYLPPLPAIVTTTTTTSTTTIPPIIMLDVQLNVMIQDFTTLKISWRKFSQQEKKFIDGIQVRYKREEESDSEYQLTQILHKDVNSYVLHDLQAATSYNVDLVLLNHPDLQTHIISSKPIIVNMPAKPKDEFDIKVSLTPKDINVDSYQTQIALNGLPKPINKFINVAKISYRSDESTQQLHTFKSPNENGKLILEGLEPNKRYKAWVDLYLANGKTVSSNAIEFTTKDKPQKINDNKIDISSNEAEALRESEVMDAKYLYGFVVVCMFAVVTGVGFVVVLFFLFRKQSTAKAPITRAPSESAYDNPTYKTYELGDRPLDDNIKNGSIQA